MRRAVLFLLMASGLALAAAGEPYQATRERASVLLDGASTKAQERAREIRSSMNLVVLSEVKLSGVPLAEAMKRISAQVKEETPPNLPGRRGMTIALQLRSEAPDLVTVDLRLASLPQVLDAICAQHHYVWSVEPYAIRVVPEDSSTIKKPGAEPAPQTK